MADRPYIPLVAGMELVRRSGGLTQFPPDYLLGNLPQARMRLKRYVAESLGRPGCMLPAAELITFLFYSDFGPADNPDSTNWSWDMTQPGEFANSAADFMNVLVAPGTPGNNIQMEQSGIFDQQPVALMQGAVPVVTGFCANLRHSVALRVYNNGYLEDDTMFVWAPNPGVIHEQPGNPGGISELSYPYGTMLIHVRRVSNNLRIEWGVGSIGAAGGGSASTTFSAMPELSSGNSIYLELYLTMRQDDTSSMAVHINGVDRGTFNAAVPGHAALANSAGALYPAVYLDGASTDGTRNGECFSIPGGFQCPTGKGTEIYTNTWKLETI